MGKEEEHEEAEEREEGHEVDGLVRGQRRPARLPRRLLVLLLRRGVQAGPARARRSDGEALHCGGGGGGGDFFFLCSVAARRGKRSGLEIGRAHV